MSMETFTPHLSILSPPQQALWEELCATPELLTVAQRVVWFKEPEDALQESIHFLAHAMRYGTVDDLLALEKAGVGMTHYREVLDNAPAGIFDARSWNFWNLKCGKTTVPPLPVRKFDLG